MKKSTLKRVAALSVAGLMATTALAGCGGESSTTSGDSSKTDAAKNIRAIGYPRDTVMVNQRPYLIVEMHDCVNDTVVYFDTIPLNTRTPSTLEDFDPKWRRYRLRN